MLLWPEFPLRLTDSIFLSTVKKLGREAIESLWLTATFFLAPPRLGGRTIGSTSDSDSDYPGSSPGLPAKLKTMDLKLSGYGRATENRPSPVWTVVKELGYDERGKPGVRGKLKALK